MRPIPVKMKEVIQQDSAMKVCIYTKQEAPNHDCYGRITWEHAFMYSGRQINEEWAIVGCCENHNSGIAMVKEYNQYFSLLKAKSLGVWEEVKKKYPRSDWDQKFEYLSKKYN